MRHVFGWSLAALGLGLLGPTTAHALIVMDSSNPSAAVNTSSSPSATPAYSDFNYWDNMLGAHTYLGNGYLLSTNHVGALPTSITIGGTPYNRVAQQQLVNPGPPSTLTDLWVWKIDGGANPLPNLPTVFPIVSTPVAGEKTLLIGDGFSRANGPTFWDITVNPGANDDVWTVLGSEAGADAKGFLEGASQPKLWGTNKVLSATNINLSGTTTKGYLVNFSTVDGTEFEAQATNDDSAGPVFVKRGDQWVLTGLMHGINAFENQPGAPGSHSGIYHYGSPSQTSITGISDLSQYTQQLIDFGVQVPEPTSAMLLVGACGAMAMRRWRGRGASV